MSMRVAILILLASSALVAACKDGSRAPAPAPSAAPARRAAIHAAAGPRLPPRAIEHIDDVPPEAHAPLATTVHAVESNQRAVFLSMVSSGGFKAGTLSLIAEQVQNELNGRTVAELVNLRPCAVANACQWSVSTRDAKRVELVASAGGVEVGAIDLVREHHGGWTVDRAR